MTVAAVALALAGAQAGPAAAPDAAAIRAAAARCALPANWLLIGHDEDGDYADPSNAQRAVRIAPEAIVCLIGWAHQTHARLGFISEPPPGPQVLAALPAASITDAARAADRCGLAVREDPLDSERSVLLARRHAPPAQLACMRAWLNAHGPGPASQ